MYLTVSTTDPSLLDRLAALEAKVSALAQASPPTPVIFSTYGGGAASSAYVNTPGLTQKIDQLSGTTLTNVTLQGTVSGITSAMLPTDLTISLVIVVSGLQVRASQADPTPKTGDGRLSYQTWEVLTAGALRPWPPRAASHRSELSSCPPEVVRPAGDETGVGWRGAAGIEVGLRLGAREPVFQLDPGPLEHPRLCHGRHAGPEHASQTSLIGAPRRRRAERRERWRSSIPAAPVSTSTRRPWSPPCAWSPAAGSPARSAPSPPRPRACSSWPRGWPRTAARTPRWRRPASTGGRSGTSWPRAGSCWSWPTPPRSRTCPAARPTSSDATWLAELLAHGLIRASFVPDAPTQELRSLLRTRKQLAREKASHMLRLQKTLEDANIKLDGVLTDLLGKSGRAMLEALAAGEADPAKLAALAHPRLSATPERLREALRGRVTAPPPLPAAAAPGPGRRARGGGRADRPRGRGAARALSRRGRAADLDPRRRRARGPGDRRRDRPRHGPVPDRRAPRLLGRAVPEERRERRQAPLQPPAQGRAVAQDHAGAVRLGGEPQEGQLPAGAVPPPARPPRAEEGGRARWRPRS